MEPAGPLSASISSAYPSYSLEDLRKHDREEDAWIAIEGQVYDVTTFLEEHPGGKEIMLEYLGKDATEVFTSEAVHAHGKTAFTMLTRYNIGLLKDHKVVNRTTENKYSNLVDITKPILPQIPKLGKDYNPWLHSHFGLQQIIIFDNALELFTRWPWWYIFFLWSPFIVMMVNKALEHVSAFHTCTMFFVGLLSWSIVEYALHRFVFHIYTYSTNWNIFHFFAHGIHHLTPNDATRLTFPPTFSIVIMFLVYQIPSFFAPTSGAQSWIAGVACGFMLYDAIHYYFHHGDAPWLPEFLKKMKSAHLDHHYKNDSKNFGVTSPLFDWVFGTYQKLNK